MNKKLLIPAIALFLVGCGGGATTSTPTTGSEPTVPPVDYNVVLDHTQTGLGNAVVTQVGDTNTYEVSVTPIESITVKEVTLNGVALTLTDGKATFEATANATDVVKVSFNEPELSESLGALLLKTQMVDREVNGYDYEYREHIKHNTLLTDYTNTYRKYTTKLHTNGILAHAEIGVGDNIDIGISDPEYTYKVNTQGRFVTYPYNDSYYVRAFEPSVYSEDGFYQILERSPFYDETSEDLGFESFVTRAIQNMSGEKTDWSADFGYEEPELSIETTDTDHVLTLTSIATFKDYPDEGWSLPAEENYYRVIIDKTSYEVKEFCSRGIVYQRDFSDPIVNTYETSYSAISYGEKTEGDIQPVNLETINPEFVEGLPEIQDLPDGDLTNKDAAKVLKNLWAYAENSKTCEASGTAVTYDADWNEIYGRNEQTTVAYKDYILMQENSFVSDDGSYTSNQVIQRRATVDGVATAVVIDGELSEMDSYYNPVGIEYFYKRQLSASPLADFSLGSGVSEGAMYELTSWQETDDYGVNGYDVLLFNASKEGNNIEIEWKCLFYYGDPSWSTPAYYKIKIENNFLCYAEVGSDPGAADNTVFVATQGEYETYTGEIYEIPVIIY